MDIDEFTSKEQLETRLGEVKDRLKELNEATGTQRFSEDSRKEWNDLNAEHDELVARLDEIEVREQRLEVLAGKTDNRVEGSSVRATRKPTWTFDMSEIRRDSGGEVEYNRKLRDTAKHFSEIERYPHPDATRTKTVEHIHDLIDRFVEQEGASEMDVNPASTEVARRILITGNPAYKRAFSKYLRGGGMTPEEQRALSVGTGPAGGFAVVYALDPTLVPTSNASVNPWRGLARIENIAGTNEWRQPTAGAITAAYSAEATEAGDNAPTLAQADIFAEKAQAYVPFSIEVGQDWSGIEAALAMELSDAKDDLEATKFALGAGHGSNEPSGVIPGATTVNTTTTAAFAVGDLYKLLEAIPPRFRPRVAFAANLFVIDKIRQFDTAGGSGVFIGPQGLQAQVDAGGVGTLGGVVRVPLLGRPLAEASAMASALTTGSKILLAGDFRYFVIVDRVGMNVETLPLVVGTNHRPTGQRGLYAYWRNSSGVLAATAFGILTT